MITSGCVKGGFFLHSIEVRCEYRETFDMQGSFFVVVGCPWYFKIALLYQLAAHPGWPWTVKLAPYKSHHHGIALLFQHCKLFELPFIVHVNFISFSIPQWALLHRGRMSMTASNSAVCRWWAGLEGNYVGCLFITHTLPRSFQGTCSSVFVSLCVCWTVWPGWAEVAVPCSPDGPPLQAVSPVSADLGCVSVFFVGRWWCDELMVGSDLFVCFCGRLPYFSFCYGFAEGSPRIGETGRSVGVCCHDWGVRVHSPPPTIFWSLWEDFLTLEAKEMRCWLAPYFLALSFFFQELWHADLLVLYSCQPIYSLLIPLGLNRSKLIDDLVNKPCYRVSGVDFQLHWYLALQKRF